MLGRLLEGLQEGIKAVVRNLMNFINDVNFVMPVRRLELDVFAQIPDFIDAAVRGTVNFKHIKAHAARNLIARDTRPARSLSRPFFTIQSFRQNPGG